MHTRRIIIRSVLAAGMAGTVASTVLAAPALAAPVTGSLAGVVRDTRGAAMAGAGIEIYDNPDAGAVIATGQTDAAGRFKVPGLNPGTYEVEVHLAGGWSDWAPGRTATPATYRVTARRTTVSRTVVAAAGTVVGRITDETGQPAGGVALVLTGLTDARPFTATTAADGSYRVEVEPDQSYVVQYTLRGIREYVPHTFDSQQAGQYPVASGHTVRIDDQAAAAAAAAGRLVDAAGAPVGGATVTFYNWGTGAESTTVTDADGNYRIDRLPPGDYKAGFAVNGHSEYAYQQLSLFDADTITLTSGAVATVDDQLLPVAE